MTLTSFDLRERVARAISSQQQRTVTVLSSLLAVEDELGYIPPEAIEAVAQLTDSTVNDVWGVASFYTNFRFDPPGTHRIEVCWGAACHVLGAPRICQEVFRALGLESEGDTADGRFSLRLNTCLGACSQGPVMSIDHRLKGRLTPDSVGQALGKLVDGTAQHDNG